MPQKAYALAKVAGPSRGEGRRKRVARRGDQPTESAGPAHNAGEPSLHLGHQSPSGCFCSRPAGFVPRRATPRAVRPASRSRLPPGCHEQHDEPAGRARARRVDKYTHMCKQLRVSAAARGSAVIITSSVRESVLRIRTGRPRMPLASREWPGLLHRTLDTLERPRAQTSRCWCCRRELGISRPPMNHSELEPGRTRRAPRLPLAASAPRSRCTKASSCSKSQPGPREHGLAPTSCLTRSTSPRGAARQAVELRCANVICNMKTGKSNMIPTPHSTWSIVRTSRVKTHNAVVVEHNGQAARTPVDRILSCQPVCACVLHASEPINHGQAFADPSRETGKGHDQKCRG